MAPRGFANPAPKTESARSALSSFTCTLCNKSYSRHPEYEAHISSYDHQHRKRLQDLKQLSRDPNAAEKARRAERKADAEAGLRVLDTGKAFSGAGPGNNSTGGATSSSTGGGGGGGGFKKGGFKSSFTKVKGPVSAAAPTKKNVLGDDDDDDDNDGDEGINGEDTTNAAAAQPSHPVQEDQAESDTEEEYLAETVGGGYYDPRKPTDCFPGCAGVQASTA
ncbi:hypothetical protein P175DRAFT_0452653 [Aspergillus ochraceoroseus IBT 24754]|uniref:C2H2-type domain-containing protein n=3 Tax=Aspergillus subgen. Nidulantes TaxID=2720870 RepID=A0A0F8V548_9EURO|nr:uncharacterized protein P175DRAFT_0452653 [Aspergillus ochraceoroseus IBT 24754]KKK18507.1 hypothetical protein AOCH_004399 [Aspergillus ochraceoroseus]KKK26883.1 hypothetical protein ARAM_001248 [Aspergillus rambellii]PTU22352.1 hypothetical protein P175DRAFT_0452653 [Aspergillus ochraceoroseus IBT 24754]